MGLPVVVIRGILEGGKTSFIMDSIAHDLFGDVGRGLILSQEEGEIEYDLELLKSKDFTVRNIERIEDWNGENINNIIHETRPQVVFIEVNEMWDFNNMKVPSFFDIEQTIGLIDGTTFNVYINNMRQKMVDFIKTCDLVIINRCLPTPETSQMKRNVKLINNGCQVMAIDENNNELKLESDLPYSVKDKEIKVDFNDFGIWYVDTFDSRDRYEGKIIEFDCMAVFSPKLPPKSFVAGRLAMTCCANDIQFIGHLCAHIRGGKIKNRSWIHLRAKIHYMKFGGNQEEQLVLEEISYEPIPEPKEEDRILNLV